MRKVVLLIFLVALLLRTIKLSTIPYGFLGDEASLGYDAFAIMKEGTDEYGVRFPLYLESIGDFKYPAYSYLLIPIIKFFGLSVFSTRLLSALSGTFTVIVLYKLVNYFTKNSPLSACGAFMLAISPWHIFFSRGAFESILGLFLSLTTLYLICKYLKNPKNKYLISALLTYVLSIFSYTQYRIILLFLPIATLLTVPFLKFKQTSRKPFLLSLALMIFITFLSIFSPQSSVRSGSLINLNVQALEVDIDSLRIHDGQANPGFTFFTKIFHNKITRAFPNLLGKYLEFLNPDFLFINGDKTRQIYNIPNVGLLYWFEIILLPLGFAYLFNKFPRLLSLSVVWFVFSTLPLSMVNEHPSSVRFLVTSPIFAILAGAGLYWILIQIKQIKSIFVNRLSFTILGLIIISNVSYVLHQYLVHFPRYRPWKRDYGMEELVHEINKLSPNYKNIVIPDDPYIFFLFHNQITPSQFLSQSELSQSGPGKWNRVERIGKIIFNMPFKCPIAGQPHTLYACKGTEIPQNSKLIHLIRFNDEIPAYSLIEFIPVSQMSNPKPELPQFLNYMYSVHTADDGFIHESINKFWI